MIIKFIWTSRKGVQDYPFMKRETNGKKLYLYEKME